MSAGKKRIQITKLKFNNARLRARAMQVNAYGALQAGCAQKDLANALFCGSLKAVERPKF
jgi:hypothetical protein